MLGAFDGVYLAGGIVKRYPDSPKASRFRAGFENKGRHRSLMERVPTLLILHPQPGLLGASFCARELLYCMFNCRKKDIRSKSSFQLQYSFRENPLCAHSEIELSHYRFSVIHHLRAVHCLASREQRNSAWAMSPDQYRKARAACSAAGLSLCLHRPGVPHCSGCKVSRSLKLT